MDNVDKSALRRVQKGDPEYQAWVRGLGERYRRSQIKASVSVNTAMLAFYWSLGRDVAGMDAENRYGSGFYETLSRDLCELIPNRKGFSPRNLRYMRRFYQLFPSVQNLPQVVAGFEGQSGMQNLPQAVANSGGPDAQQADADLFAVPWGHMRTIIDKCGGDREKAEFYVHETVRNGWSRAVLLNHLGASLYERHGKAVSNFGRTLPEPQGDLAQQITRDPYQFDFLDIRREHDERELKDALVGNITAFLLELGTGFAFVGREYRILVGETEQWVDLLFYHFRLRCFVVIEVKIVPFEPAFVGQLGTYVAAVNHILRGDGDQPTVGLLVCKTKDDVLAQYALEGSSQPIGISEYELAGLMPEGFESSMPTIEEIEAELSD